MIIVKLAYKQQVKVSHYFTKSVKALNCNILISCNWDFKVENHISFLEMRREIRSFHLIFYKEFQAHAFKSSPEMFNRILVTLPRILKPLQNDQRQFTTTFTTDEVNTIYLCGKDT